MTVVRRIRIALAVACGLAVVVPIALFGIYDLVSFQSRRAEIRSLGMQAPLPAALAAMMRANYEKNGYSHITARILINKLPIARNHTGAMGWQATFATWTLLARLHLDEQEQFALIAANSYMGQQRGHERFGFGAEAMARFGKPLTSLNDNELATLVVLPRSPSMFQEEPEVLQICRDRLLEKIQGNRSPIPQ
jgi:hypothetical protein